MNHNRVINLSHHKYNVTHRSCIGGKQTYTSILRPLILHTPALVLERQEHLFNYVSATNSGNVLCYAVPYMDHTTLGCKEVLV